jgi:hypothetical protein
MIFLPSIVKRSPISGMGVFVDVRVKKGDIVGCMALDSILISETDYQAEQDRGNDEVLRSCIRLAGVHFLYAKAIFKDGVEQLTEEDFINHSESPSPLYHCGMLFARRNLEAGEEFTVDYKYFLAFNDATCFVDGATGRKIACLDGAEALRESTSELLALLRSGDLPKTPPLYVFSARPAEGEVTTQGEPLPVVMGGHHGPRASRSRGFTH